MNRYIPALAVLAASVAATIYWCSTPWQLTRTNYTIKETSAQCTLIPTNRLVGLLLDDEQAILRTHWFSDNVLKIYAASYEIGCDLTDTPDWYQYSASGTSVTVTLPGITLLNETGIDASLTVDVYGSSCDADELGSMLREAETKMQSRAMSQDNITTARRNIERLTHSLFWQLPTDSIAIRWQ